MAGEVFFCLEQDWIAVGGKDNMRAKLLMKGERIQCFAAADDWLNQYETNDTAHRSRSWLNEEPTTRQLEVLPNKYRLNFHMTRYWASALIGFNKNKSAIMAIANRYRK